MVLAFMISSGEAKMSIANTFSDNLDTLDMVLNAEAGILDNWWLDNWGLDVKAVDNRRFGEIL